MYVNTSLSAELRLCMFAPCVLTSDASGLFHVSKSIQSGTHSERTRSWIPYPCLYLLRGRNKGSLRSPKLI